METLNGAWSPQAESQVPMQHLPRIIQKELEANPASSDMKEVHTSQEQKGDSFSLQSQNITP